VALDEHTILTAAHVVEGAQRIELTLADGRTMPAEVCRRHDSLDACVLRASESLGVHGRLMIGAATTGAAILTTREDGHGRIGVVTRLDASLTDALGESHGRDYSRLIETDLALAPGFSGSPLFDAAGRLIGLNVAVASVHGARRAYALPAHELPLAAPTRPQGHGINLCQVTSGR
jgi:S1-C subfamily serine protease